MKMSGFIFRGSGYDHVPRHSTILRKPDRETNAVELSLKTGGIVKVDVKAWTPSI